MKLAILIVALALLAGCQPAATAPGYVECAPGVTVPCHDRGTDAYCSTHRGIGLCPR